MMSARSDSQSTILPLPSSPHWAPITTTLAISTTPAESLPGVLVVNSPRHGARYRRAVEQNSKLSQEGAGGVSRWELQRKAYVFLLHLLRGCQGMPRDAKGCRECDPMGSL